MKRLLSCLSVVLVVMLVSNPAGAVSLSIDPTYSLIELGDSVDVNINISGLENDNIAGFDFFILYDSAILSFDNHFFGDELGVIPTEALDLTMGDELVELSLIPSDADTGGTFFADQPDAFTLATLTFTGIGTGISDLKFGAPFFGYMFTDERGHPIALQAGFLPEAQIEVDPVPEPSTFALLGIGIIGLAGYVRRRNRGC